MHSTLSDLSGTLGAFLLFPLVLVLPGYVLGYATNLLRFNAVGFFYRLSISLLVSLSLCPIIVFLMAKVGGMGLVWLSFVSCWLFFSYLTFSGRVVSKALFWSAMEGHRKFIFFASLCLIITASMIVDFEMDGRLIRPLLSYDYVKHTAVTSAISRTGIPPVNPSFFPGEPLSLFYYYFWFALCSLVDVLGGAFITPRHAVLGSILWGEISLFIIFLMYMKRQGQDLVIGLLPRHYKWGLLLLLVTGLDIIPIFSKYLTQRIIGISDNIVPSIEWWNEQVSSWMSAILWVPHHLVALICCLFAFLLINEQFTTDWGKKNPRLLMGYSALALASAFGMSIWVTFVAATILLVWIATAYKIGRREEIMPLIFIGLSTTILLLPFIVDLQGSQSMDRIPLVLTVRIFPILDQIPVQFSEAGKLALRFLALPLNYTLELGFFLLGSLLYIPYRKSFDKKMTREEQFMLVVVLVSIFVCTFFKSNIKFNDLGWRGFMFAQFGMWLVSIPLCLKCTGKKEYQRFALEKSVRVVALLMLFTGLLSNMYESVVLRKFSYAEQGAYALALRQTYEWINDNTPEGYVTQHNPNTEIDYFHALYGNRQVAIADTTLGRLYGVSDSLFFEKERPIKDLFYGNPAVSTVVSVASEYHIELLVVKREDPVWKDAASWVWQADPVFKNEFCRVYLVSSLAQ